MKKLTIALIIGSLFLATETIAQNSSATTVKPKTFFKITKQLNSAKQSSAGAKRSLTKAKAKVPRTPSSSINSLSRYKSVTTELASAEERLNELDQRIEELSKLTEQLNNEKIDIEIEKQSLAAREDLFKKGFYASLTTAVLALFGLIIKAPIFRTEFRIKELEREKLEMEVDALKKANQASAIIR